MMIRRSPSILFVLLAVGVIGPAPAIHAVEQAGEVELQDGLRLTCRCSEEIAGKKLHDPPETEYTTYTWVYQW